MYANFDLVVPTDMDEALAALSVAPVMQGDQKENDCVPLGGGTNLIVEIRALGIAPETLVSVAQLASLRGISVADGRVILGGATTVSEILRHPEMPVVGAALVDAAKVFAGQMVRNTATVAGNICCGSPAADLVPPLLSLGAVVTLQNNSGRRDVPLAEYFTGYKSSVRRPDELMTAVSWPLPPEHSTSCFYKLARRKGDAITVLGVAVSMSMENGACSDARIALGCVGPYVMRAVKAESLLEGQTLTTDLIEANQAMEESNPIDDVRASAEYRKQQVPVLVRRLLTQVRNEISQGNQTA